MADKGVFEDIVLRMDDGIILKLTVEELKAVMSACEKRGNDLAQKGTRICEVVSCRNSEFHDIECLEDDEKYGFFKSDSDMRPGHAIWIKKKDAERLHNLFSER